MINRDDIIAHCLKVRIGQVWSASLAEIEAAFPAKNTRGRSAVDFINEILAARGGPQGKIAGPRVIFSHRDRP